MSEDVLSEEERRGAELFRSLREDEKERVLRAYIENIKRRKSEDDDEIFTQMFEESKRADLIKMFLNRCFEEFCRENQWEGFKFWLTWDQKIGMRKGTLSLIEEHFMKVENLARRSPQGDLFIILPLGDKIPDVIDVLASYSCGNLTEEEALDELNSMLENLSTPYEYGPLVVMESARTLVAYLISKSLLLGDLDLKLHAKLMLKEVGASPNLRNLLITSMKRNYLKLLPLALSYTFIKNVPENPQLQLEMNCKFK